MMSRLKLGIDFGVKKVYSGSSTRLMELKVLKTL
jgi:hypothetical protein